LIRLTSNQVIFPSIFSNDKRSFVTKYLLLVRIATAVFFFSVGTNPPGLFLDNILSKSEFTKILTQTTCSLQTRSMIRIFENIQQQHTNF